MVVSSISDAPVEDSDNDVESEVVWMNIVSVEDGFDVSREENCCAVVVPSPLVGSNVAVDARCELEESDRLLVPTSFCVCVEIFSDVEEMMDRDDEPSVEIAEEET